MRALFIFAKLNTGVRYVQGMNEVYAPLYYVFKADHDATWAAHAEGDAFSCYVELLSEFRDNFCKQLVRGGATLGGTVVQSYGRTVSALMLSVKRYAEPVAHCTR